jgi:hypothetical protein
MKENRKQLRFNVAFVLLLVGLFVMVFLSFSIVNGNNSYSQFTHILQSLYGDGGNAGATAIFSLLLPHILLILHLHYQMFSRK